MATDKKIAEARKTRINEASWSFDYVLSWGESPIEQLLLAKLLMQWGVLPGLNWNSVAGWSLFKKAGVDPRINPNGLPQFLFNDNHYMLVQPKVVDMPYRLDFAMLCGGEKFAIDADGHEFHAATKAQVRHDKQRDRALTLAGWKVLRFTGSEIYADPDGVVRQLHRAADDAIGRRAALKGAS